MIREESDETVETHPVRHPVLDDVADENLFRARPRGNNWTVGQYNIVGALNMLGYCSVTY